MRIPTLTLTAALAILCAATAGTLSRSAPGRELRTNARDVNAANDVDWSVQTSGIDTNLRGVSAADNPDSNGQHVVVWACGSNGVILFSNDLGKTWKRLHVAGGDALDFRSVVAFDAKTALVMSSGEGEKSRIYKTIDGGETWKLEFTDKRPTFFLDALVCNRDCYALSDSPDFGKTWTVADTPIASGNASSGIFSLVATPWAVVVVGGDYKDPSRPSKVAAYSQDEGKTWTLAAQQPGGYRSAVVALYGAMLAVGPTGEDISEDFGAHWKKIGSLDLNAAFVLDIYNGWAVGAKGTIARLVNHAQYQIRNDGPRDEFASSAAALSR